MSTHLRYEDLNPRVEELGDGPAVRVTANCHFCGAPVSVILFGSDLREGKTVSAHCTSGLEYPSWFKLEAKYSEESNRPLKVEVEGWYDWQGNSWSDPWKAIRLLAEEISVEVEPLHHRLYTALKNVAEGYVWGAWNNLAEEVVREAAHEGPLGWISHPERIWVTYAQIRAEGNKVLVSGTAEYRGEEYEIERSFEIETDFEEGS